MKLSTFIQRMRTRRPDDIRAINQLGVKTRLIGSGAFRAVYLVKGLDVVVKIPLDPGALGHARKEIRILRELSKIHGIKRFVPTLFYSDIRTGVLVVQKYARARSIDKVLKWRSEILSEFDFHGWKHDDFHKGNVGYDKHQHPVMIDLGIMRRTRRRR